MSPRRTMIVALVALGGLTTACNGSGDVGSPLTAGTIPDTSQPTGDSAPDATTSDGAPDSTDHAPDSPVATVDWGTCADDSVTDDSLECATLSVPLDYDQPAGQHIDIAMVRVPASGDDRVGAVLFNPGGPGASGFDYIAQGGTTIVAALGLQQFDLIGFDPRGVERSNGLRCLTDTELDASVYLDNTPDDAAQQAALDAADEHFDTACVSKYGETLRNYSTDATARDMDAIRAGLGDDQISYLGVSYGTYLGATYATLFPDRVRAMVLDSAFDPVGDTVEQAYTTQLVGFEQAFDRWATWCESAEACAFRSADVGADWDALSATLDATPVTQDDGRSANQVVMQIATIAALYSEGDWPTLADALAAVRDGDPQGLFALADGYIGRADDGTYSTIEQSGTIIRCASGISPPPPDDPAALVATLHQLAPRFSRGTTVDDFTDGCAPLMPGVSPQPLQYDGDGAVVVIGGTNDPATPFRWAEKMDQDMGPNAGLVTYTGEGHGVLLASTCGTAIEAALLTDLTVPADGTTCEPDPEVERPSWWDDIAVPAGVSPIYDKPAVTKLLGLGSTLAYTELHTSTLSTDDVLSAYDDSLATSGFEKGGRQDPLPGLTQAVYLSADGGVLSLLVFGPDSFDQPELQGLSDLVPPGETLIVLLAPKD